MDVTPRQLARELAIKWDTAQRMKRALKNAMAGDEGNFRLDIRLEADKAPVDQK